MKKRHIFISYLLIVNLYLDLSVFGVDSLLLIMALPYLFTHHGNGKLLISVLSIIFLYLLTCFFSGIPGEIKSEFLSFIQFLIALLIFFSLNKYSEFICPAQFNDMVFKCFLAVSVISIIQFLKFDSGFIEHTRSILHPNIYDLSEETSRDELLSLSGAMRPLGLAKEPSYLSIFVIFCGYVLLTLGRRAQKITFLILFGFFLYTNTSPLLGFLPMIVALHYFLNVNSTGLKIMYSSLLLLMAFFCLMLLRWRFEITTGYDLSWNFIYEVYEKGLVTTESSLGIRIFNPFVTMYNVLSDNLFFGSGFANIDYIERHSEVAIFRPKNVLSNALASGFIYTGIMGMTFIFTIILFQTKITFKVLLPFILIISFTGGGFFTIRFWSMAFLFIVVFFLYERGRQYADMQKY